MVEASMQIYICVCYDNLYVLTVHFDEEVVDPEKIFSCFADKQYVALMPFR